MTPRILNYTFPAAKFNEIFTTKDIAGAGVLTLDGNLVNPIDGQVNFINNGYCRDISITSAEDLTGVVFTVTGSQNGVELIEDVTGPNNTTVYSTKYFDVITSISCDGAADDVNIGTGYSGFFKILSVNLWSNPAEFTFTIASSEKTKSLDAAIYATLKPIFNSGVTFQDFVTNDNNCVEIEAATATEQYTYTNLTEPTYSYFLIKFSPNVTSADVSMNLNFIQS